VFENASANFTNDWTLPLRICSVYATTLGGSSIILVGAGAGGTGAVPADGAAELASAGTAEDWGVPLLECS